MNKQYDAIIIGAGIIGAAIAFELSKKGYKTLNVDKLPSAGHGSTSGSCAIIRLHYSTPDGVAWPAKDFITGSTGPNTWRWKTSWVWQNTLIPVVW